MDIALEKSQMTDWINYPNRGKGWVPGRVIRTNGFELHLIYEKGVKRGNAGKRRKVSSSHFKIKLLLSDDETQINKK